ncbi:Putative Virulence-associated protein, VapC [Methyloversatilis universalis FAM5]|uniref:Ribonuclease VapC n=2 Tax=Methyloversatilis universalis TaxID=378211 RepID=F5RE59_METUF|nr:Putative Virulence-associated protein, VapC [Methyloversatilis universalis FAM5]
MAWMLDTNICIYLMKQAPPQVIARLESLREGDAVMSVVTYAELRAGLEMREETRARDESVLEALVQRIPVLPFDIPAAQSFGALRAAVRDRRRNALDRMIAAHAVSVDAILVTNNEADFADYPGLVVENWTREAGAPV